MNVLILTPDRVGSTLLQRLITIYMLRKGYDLPVINLHELSNGLKKYYNEKLGQEIVGKPQGVEWGYYQTLPSIIDLLDSANHYKTSRLAHYHLVNRKDSIADQLKFYDYLNRNFYIISCRRDNLLEHALSWVIHGHSKHLNVYSAEEKIDIFDKIYQHGITGTQATLENYLNKYHEYSQWVDTYFNVQSYFDYDKDLDNIENYILNLDFMHNNDHKDNSWTAMFGQDFKTWNTCHRMLPNLLLNDTPSDATLKITINKNVITQDTWLKIRGDAWPQTVSEYEQNTALALPTNIDQEIKTRFGLVDVSVTQEQHTFLSKNLLLYNNASRNIEQLKEFGMLVTGVPLKLQSLREKQQVIRNFDQCVDWYNQWVDKTGYGKKYTITELNVSADQEENLLNNAIKPSLSCQAHK
jgi:hypothetical protein